MKSIAGYMAEINTCRFLFCTKKYCTNLFLLSFPFLHAFMILPLSLNNVKENFRKDTIQMMRKYRIMSKFPYFQQMAL